MGREHYREKIQVRTRSCASLRLYRRLRAFIVARSCRRFGTLGVKLLILLLRSPYGQQSGLGFQGIHRKAIVPTNGTEFHIGTLIHYNHAVS